MDIRKYFSPLQKAYSTRITTIQLDTESWIEQGNVPNELCQSTSFDELWKMHPEEYGEVRYSGTIVKTPRWQQSYIRDYNFSGMNHCALPLPKQFKPFLDWANQLVPNITFNQVLVNIFTSQEFHCLKS